MDYLSMIIYIICIMINSISHPWREKPYKCIFCNILDFGLQFQYIKMLICFWIIISHYQMREWIWTRSLNNMTCKYIYPCHCMCVFGMHVCSCQKRVSLNLYSAMHTCIQNIRLLNTHKVICQKWQNLKNEYYWTRNSHYMKCK